jgi:hypothetical protein
MALKLLPLSIRKKYEIREWKHASAILAADFPDELKDIIDLLLQFKFCKSWITVGGVERQKWQKLLTLSFSTGVGLRRNLPLQSELMTR